MLNKNCPDGAAVGEYLDLVVGDGFHECCLRCSKILESEGTAAELVGVVVLVLLHGWLHHLLLNELSSTITSISSWSVFVIAKAEFAYAHLEGSICPARSRQPRQGLSLAPP
jgi:hypothetical protein